MEASAASPAATPPREADTAAPVEGAEEKDTEKQGDGETSEVKVEEGDAVTPPRDNAGGEEGEGRGEEDVKDEDADAEQKTPPKLSFHDAIASMGSYEEYKRAVTLQNASLHSLAKTSEELSDFNKRSEVCAK